MIRFMNDGNIRIMAETPGVDLSSKVEPTREQYETIRAFAESSRRKEYFNVDLSDERGNNVGTLEYDGNVNPTRIINDIKHFYAKGEVREQSSVSQFHYSTMDKDVQFEAHKYYDRIVQKMSAQNPTGYTKVGEIKQGSIYDQIGMPVGSTYFDNSKILKEMNKDGDPLPVKYLQKVPEILAHPVVIVEAKEQNTISVFGEILQDTGTPLMVGIVAVRDRTGRSIITKVRTTHQRFRDLGNLVTDKSVLYINEDKKTAKAWFQASRIDMPLGGNKFGFIRSITLSEDIVKLSDLKPQKKYSTQDKDFHLTQRIGERRVFEMRGTTANVYGSSVELEGGTLLNRVRMMQNLAEVYGSGDGREWCGFEKMGTKYRLASYNTVTTKYVESSQRRIQHMFNNLGGTNLTWLLVLLLLLGDNDNGMGGISCDTLIWLLLLSRFCGGENGCGCGCGNQNRNCGCSAM